MFTPQLMYQMYIQELFKLCVKYFGHSGTLTICPTYKVCGKSLLIFSFKQNHTIVYFMSVIEAIGYLGVETMEDVFKWSVEEFKDGNDIKIPYNESDPKRLIYYIQYMSERNSQIIYKKVSSYMFKIAHKVLELKELLLHIEFQLSGKLATKEGLVIARKKGYIVRLYIPSIIEAAAITVSEKKPIDIVIKYLVESILATLLHQEAEIIFPTTMR